MDEIRTLIILYLKFIIGVYKANIDKEMILLSISLTKTLGARVRDLARNTKFIPLYAPCQERILTQNGGSFCILLSKRFSLSTTDIKGAFKENIICQFIATAVCSVKGELKI
uniref:Uncharacterized protein n=1 Tax=Glossina austeni TaxID=7395 RepID=A0A1A9V821_GLOAU